MITGEDMQRLPEVTKPVKSEPAQEPEVTTPVGEEAEPVADQADVGKCLLATI